MSKLEQLLERIAVAIEKIAKITQPEPEVPFPWGDQRIQARVRNRRYWHDDRPGSFEAMIKIGRDALMNRKSLTRNIGKKGIESLDVVFEENGFGDRWKNS